MSGTNQASKTAAPVQPQKKDAAQAQSARQGNPSPFFRSGARNEVPVSPPVTKEAKEEPKGGKAGKSEGMDEATRFAVGGIMRSFGTMFPLDETGMEVRY